MLVWNDSDKAMKEFQIIYSMRCSFWKKFGRKVSTETIVVNIRARICFRPCGFIQFSSAVPTNEGAVASEDLQCLQVLKLDPDLDFGDVEAVN